MTIKIGDAVMTPDGVAVVTEIRGDWPVREIWVTFSAGVRRWYAEKNLDRLVLDTGLEERIREWAKRSPLVLDPAQKGYRRAQRDVLDILGDVAPAKPTTQGV